MIFRNSRPNKTNQRVFKWKYGLYKMVQLRSRLDGIYKYPKIGICISYAWINSHFAVCMQNNPSANVTYSFYHIHNIEAQCKIISYNLAHTFMPQWVEIYLKFEKIKNVMRTLSSFSDSSNTINIRSNQRFISNKDNFSHQHIS